MVGQACFWFSQGCTPGCDQCSGNGDRYPNFDHCPDQAKSLKPSDILSKDYWTGDKQWKEGSSYDIYKFNPWRAPGKAPIFDPCGMAGGRWTETFNAAAFNTTTFAKMGDLGSDVLKARPTGTVWTKGGVAATRWTMTANHGGGYLFRLCPANEPLTEECFQKTPLKFASEKSVLRFADPSKDKVIDAITVQHGGGIGWRLVPKPKTTFENCDYNATKEGHHCKWKCPGCGAPTYAADESCPDICAKHWPGTQDDRPIVQPYPDQTGAPITEFATEDSIVVPSDITAGDYVLGWRWDCEHSSQIWHSCSDITIVDAPSSFDLAKDTLV